MKPSGVRPEVRASDLFPAAGLSGQALRAVPFAAILAEGNENAVPASPGAYLIMTVADRHVVGIGSTGSGPKRTGTLAERMGMFVAAALGFPVRHSSGRRFWATRSAHGLRLADLTVICLPGEDARGIECKLFDAYQAASGHLPMLCKARPRCYERGLADR